jgi:hypothetical protein
MNLYGIILYGGMTKIYSVSAEKLLNSALLPPINNPVIGKKNS